MNRKKIDFAPSFLRKAGKLLKRNPLLKESYKKLLLKIECNPFDPTLHTHALTGNLKGKYGCSLTHDLRVIFSLYDDIVYLLDIGSHDDVY
jgi:addiction module RelE/StbE family toxin